MTATDLSKKQLATILSALDDAPRSPANKGEALRAIGRSAQRFRLTGEDVLAAAPGLLDGRLRPAEFRVELHDLGNLGQSASGKESPATAQVDPGASDTTSAPAESAQAAQTAPPARRETKAKAAKPAKPAKVAPVEKPTPRTGTKQALMIEMLTRPEGATVDQIAEATGWQKHTIRGAISGALKKKLGLAVEAIRIREVGPNNTGAKGSATVYRITGPAEGQRSSNGSGTETP
jgi:hypothetical protein